MKTTSKRRDELREAAWDALAEIHYDIDALAEQMIAAGVDDTLMGMCVLTVDAELWDRVREKEEAND